MDLGFQETLETIADDWPTPENIKKWKQEWENEPVRKQLVFRHIVYTKNRIERVLGGVELTTIELVLLRHIVEQSLLRTIQYAENEDRVDAGLMPIDEATYQFFDECMDLPLHLLQDFGKKVGHDTVREYLRRTHARMNGEI